MLGLGLGLPRLIRGGQVEGGGAGVFEDFSSFADNTSPADAGFTVSWETPDDAGVFNQQFRIAVDSNSRYGVFWDAAGTTQDSVVRGLLTVGLDSAISISSRSGFILRGSPGAGSANADGYIVFLQLDGNDVDTTLRIGKLEGGSYTDVVTTSTKVVTVANPELDQIWVKAEIVGSTIRAKFWDDEDPEPAGWDLEGTDSTHTEGQTGLYARENVLATDISNDRALTYDNLGSAPTEAELDALYA